MAVEQHSERPGPPAAASGRRTQGHAFISYRRGDTAAYAGRLHDRLNVSFPGQIFIDREIPAGADFVTAIEQKLEGCTAVIVLIGENWAAGDRLKDRGDFVRLEIATALKRNLRVFPVLLRSAQLPPAEALPDDLQDLLRRQAITITDEYWDSGCERLIKALQPSLGPVGKRSNAITRWRIILPLAVLLILSLAVGVRSLITSHPAPKPVVFAPSASSISPPAGHPGTAVTISGSNFGATQGNSFVRFGTVTASIMYWSANSISATVPELRPGDSTAIVTVDGRDSAPLRFTVIASAPPPPGPNKLDSNSPAVNSPEYQRVKDRYTQTQAQASAVLSQWKQTQDDVARSGGSLRPDEQTALNLLQASMSESIRRLHSGDVAGASHSLDTAQQQMKLLQQFAE